MERHPLARGYEVVCCERCGMGFANTAVTQAEYDKFYAEESKYADPGTSTGSGFSARDLMRLRETAKMIKKFSPDQDKLIVDLGCAGGGLLLELKKLGFQNLKGIDPSAACVREAQRLTDLEILKGSFPELRRWTGSVGGVILSHVLEHVRDFQCVFSVLQANLKAAGWLYIEVPDASRYQAYLSAAYQDFNTEHINHFSPQSLRNLLGSFGYVVFQEGQKVIETGPSVEYPAIFCFAQKEADVPPLVSDIDLKYQLRDYVAKSEALMSKLRESLSRILENVPQVLIWGTGQLTLKLMLEPVFRKVEIVAFVDSNPVHQGRQKMGKPVLSPGQLQSYPYPILVSSLVNEAPILQTIEHLRLPNRVYTLKSGLEGVSI